MRRGREWARPALAAVVLSLACAGPLRAPAQALTPRELASMVVDTGQNACFDLTREIPCPDPGDSFFGQDAQYAGPAPSYIDHGDGTLTDRNTGLMWTRSPDLDGDGHIDIADKLTYAEAVNYAATLRVAGYDDWRLPTIDELYSLMDFRGVDISGPPMPGKGSGSPFWTRDPLILGTVIPLPASGLSTPSSPPQRSIPLPPWVET